MDALNADVGEETILMLKSQAGDGHGRLSSFPEEQDVSPFSPRNPIAMQSILWRNKSARGILIQF